MLKVTLKHVKKSQIKQKDDDPFYSKKVQLKILNFG